jgi:hypothetical protein
VNRETDTVTVTDAGRVVLTRAVRRRQALHADPGRAHLPVGADPTRRPHGAYGPYIFGLGAVLDAYSVFNGGDAQIGLHGQDEPWSIGHPVSHGCVRVANNVISKLAAMLPLGTPVTITESGGPRV